MTFPGDAGIGAAAHRCAQAASDRSCAGMVARRDQQQRGGVRVDAVQGEQARGTGGDEGDDELVQALELAVENSVRRPSSRSAMRVA